MTELLELVTGEPKLVGLLPVLDAVPGEPGFPMGRLLGSPPIVPPEEPDPGEKEVPGLVISGLLVVLLAEAGTLTVALAEFGPLEEPVAVTLVLAEVAPGTNTVWPLLVVPAGEVTLTVLVPPAPLELAKTVELPWLEVSALAPIVKKVIMNRLAVPLIVRQDVRVFRLCKVLLNLKKLSLFGGGEID